jgi:hypothetical protein
MNKNQKQQKATNTSNIKRIMISYDRLPEGVAEKLNEKFPNGFEEDANIMTMPNGTFFKAVDFEYNDIKYLVKLPMEIDDTTDVKDDIDVDIDIDVVVSKPVLEDDIPEIVKNEIDKAYDSEEEEEEHIIIFDDDEDNNQ